MPPPSPPTNLPQPPIDNLRVRLGSVVAALAKLNITIPVEDLLKGIREEDEANRTKFTPEEFQERKSALSPRSIPDN